MGNTWTVYAWIEMKHLDKWDYMQIYAGESRRTAMRKAREAKEAGCGCVKIEWRGQGA